MDRYEGLAEGHNMWRIVLTVVQVFSAFAIVGLVLLQRGKGAEAGAGFGAGASGTVFGARGATTALSRATAIFAAVFMINSLLLTYVGTKGANVQPKTLLDEVSETASKSPPASGAQTPPVVPGTTAAPAPTPAPSTSAPATTAPSTPAPESAPTPSPAPAAPESTAPPK
jgi:preprotein translocase subunit SecG